MSNLINWERAKRLLQITSAALVLSLLGFFASGYIERGHTISSLATTQARQRPVSLFIEASFAAQSCRRDYDERFFADVAASIVTPREALTPEVLAGLRAAVAEDQDALARMRELCPSPIPPRFDENGTLVSPPVTPPLTPLPETSTTTPPTG